MSEQETLTREERREAVLSLLAKKKISLTARQINRQLSRGQRTISNFVPSLKTLEEDGLITVDRTSLTKPHYRIRRP